MLEQQRLTTVYNPAQTAKWRLLPANGVDLDGLVLLAMPNTTAVLAYHS
jgi:hypothetical protein